MASRNISSPFSVSRADRNERSNKGVSNSASSSCTRFDTADCVVCIVFAACAKPPATTPAGSVGDFIDEVAEGDVIVIENDGRTDCTVWGDIMTQYAGLRRIGATVIDGVCRDVSKALGDGYPLFTKGRFMRTGKDRVQVEAVGVPVSIGTARVAARDIVVADANGVVVVPRERAREVADVARKIEAVEAEIRAQIAQGKTLGQAREALGYHTLQRKA